jgi:hypothetical protein
MSLGKVDDNRIQETIEVLQKFVDQVSAIDIAKDVDIKDILHSRSYSCLG